MLITNLFAAVLLLEAGGEGTKGMLAVKEVVINRAHKHNKSINDILLEPKQFSCLNGISPAQAINKANHTFNGGERSDIALLISLTPNNTNITKGATHYCRIDCHPKWEKEMICTVIIGNHKFFKEKQTNE